VSVLTAGSFIPACIVVGVAWGWKTWTDSERERQEADRCAALRVKRHKPNLRCTFTRPKPERPASIVRVKAPAPAFITAQDLVAP
jgi:hypothetical protein